MQKRPLECHQCKKKPSVIYQEVIGTNIAIYQMCTQCPKLKKKFEKKSKKENFLEFEVC